MGTDVHTVRNALFYNFKGSYSGLVGLNLGLLHPSVHHIELTKAYHIYARDLIYPRDCHQSLN